MLCAAQATSLTYLDVSENSLADLHAAVSLVCRWCLQLPALHFSCNFNSFCCIFSQWITTRGAFGSLRRCWLAPVFSSCRTETRLERTASCHTHYQSLDCLHTLQLVLLLTCLPFDCLQRLHLLPSLRSVSIRGNPLTLLPAGRGLTHLTALDVSRCAIESLVSLRMNKYRIVCCNGITVSA